MPDGKLNEKIAWRISEAEKEFEAEKKNLFESTSDQTEIASGRVYLKSLEQRLAELHEVRVCLAKTEPND